MSTQTGEAKRVNSLIEFPKRKGSITKKTGSPYPDEPPALEIYPLQKQLEKETARRQKAEDDLRGALQRISELESHLNNDTVYLREETEDLHDASGLVGQSDGLKRVLGKTYQVAPTDSTVIILGETGTGKELVARAIHSRSRRKHRPLVKVNCAAIPATLIESEFFGHEKGAFTGALTRKVGRFELAHGCSLFLDEIGDLPLELQSKLLRVLQDGKFERLGSTRTTKVDVRVITATNRNLEEETREGRFRADLYYRLNVFPIEIPPLRERTTDIPLLVWYFISKHKNRLGKNINQVSKNVMDTLTHYHWPGNVRELENRIERAIILSSGPDLKLTERLPLDAAPVESGSLLDAERHHILKVLEACQWRIKGRGNAAERLGMNPSTLRSRMKKLTITRPHSAATNLEVS